MKIHTQLKAFTAGAGSGGGVAGIANLLAKQNAQVRQQISADIGKQEAANQRLAVQGAEKARGIEMQSALAQDKMRVQSALQRERIQMAQAKFSYRYRPIKPRHVYVNATIW